MRREIIESDTTLAHAGVVFRRTHSIAELLDLLHDRGVGVPPFSEQLDELDPYAVEARHGIMELTSLDRANLSRITEAVVSWAEVELATGPNAPNKGSPKE
jgi:hypothetical protein